MGQAKLRGTFEQRKAAAVSKRKSMLRMVKASARSLGKHNMVMAVLGMLGLGWERK